MKILLAADHAGFALKDRIKALLAKRRHDVVDLTPVFQAGDDYPSVADKLASQIVKSPTTPSPSSGRRGILFCGSGVGVCIAANRHKGIRAAVGHDAAEVKLAREHNDINILCLSGWNYTDETKALKLIDAFLKTKHSTAARHLRRVKELG